MLPRPSLPQNITPHFPVEFVKKIVFLNNDLIAMSETHFESNGPGKHQNKIAIYDFWNIDTLQIIKSLEGEKIQIKKFPKELAILLFSMFHPHLHLYIINIESSI